MFVVAGESLIDLVSDPRGDDGLVRMTAYQGGSAYNCARALGLLERETGFLCPISDDDFGAYLLEPLKRANVSALIEARVAAPSTLAVVTLNAKGQASYRFHRGADRAFTRESLIAALPERPTLFEVGGFCTIAPADTPVWLDVIDEAARRGAIISIDPNVRPSLVDDFADYVARLDQFFGRTHIIKMSIEDLERLDATLSVEDHAAAFLAHENCRLFVLTLGEDGSRAFSRSSAAEAGIYTPAVFGDTVGAGDSLMAGILTFLHRNGHLTPERLAALDAATLEAMLAFGAVVAGLNCGHKGCQPPTLQEAEAALGTG
ncbi:MAG: PfkB family carbohydrate kinase [Devosia sp.]